MLNQSHAERSAEPTAAASLPSRKPPAPKPQFITMKDDHKNIVEIPIEQENVVAIFKAMGYREVQMAEGETDDAHEDQ